MAVGRAGYNSFDYNEQMLNVMRSIERVTAAIATKIGVTASELNRMRVTVKDMGKDAEQSSDRVLKNSKTIANTAHKIYTNLRLKEIVHGVGQIHKQIFEIGKSVQSTTGATLQEWNTLYKSLLDTTRQMNQQIGASQFNAREFYVAAQQLAKIGWSDLKALNKVTPAITKLQRAIGETPVQIQGILASWQKVFKDGTADLVEGIGDVLTAYSELFDVNAQELEDATAALNSTMLRLSGGDQERYAQMNESLLQAISLSSKLGMDSSHVRTLLNTVLNASPAELSQMATSFGISNLDWEDVQRQMQGGDFLGAATRLFQGIASTQSGDLMTSNIYKDLLGSLGLSDDDVNYLFVNMGSMEEYLREIVDVSKKTQGIMDKRIGGYMLSLSDRISNWMSGSKTLGSLQVAASQLGIGSFTDLLGVFSSASMIRSGIKDISANGGFNWLKNAVGLGTEGATIGSVGIFKVIGTALTKFVPILLAVVAGVKLLSELINQESVRDAIGRLMDAFGKLVKAFGKLWDAFSTIIEKLAKSLAPAISAIVDTLSVIIGALADVVDGIFGWLGWLLEGGSGKYDLSSTLGGLVYGFGQFGNKVHLGTDIPMASGTPIRAAQAGVVTGSGYNGTYGKYLSVLGADGIERVFGHLLSSAVSIGTSVMPGQLLAASGNTGDSIAPHLHYETRKGNVFYNPEEVENNSLLPRYVADRIIDRIVDINVRQQQEEADNDNVVKAIYDMTSRLEQKLEEVSQQTDDNSNWIAEFDKEVRARERLPI